MFAAGSPAFAAAEAVRPESVITVTGQVVPREAGTVNPKLPTGEIELRVADLVVQSAAEVLPMQVAGDEKFPEDIRLRYRFIDLRRDKLHRNMMLRVERHHLDPPAHDRGRASLEYQTPILTASSPEGARDFLVPARLHPGKFYALPQAPQQFKQLLMVAGLRPLFPDRALLPRRGRRADRSPGEFYQLDFEMSYVTQEDVFATIEPVIAGVFEEFAEGRAVTPAPFPRIPYDKAMLEYGSDKPDLRNPLRIADVTDALRRLRLRPVRADRRVGRHRARDPGARRRRAAAQLLRQAERMGARPRAQGGLGYIVYDADGPKGPIARNLEAGTRRGDPRRLRPERRRRGVLRRRQEGRRAEIRRRGAHPHRARNSSLSEKGAFRFCWITDFPMFELNEETKQIDFSHNPFSMPQGGLEALNTQDPLTIKAYQYDIVCNGIELSSGAIRNHRPDIMIKAFAIAGYHAGGSGSALRRHAERVPLRRAAAWRRRRPASTASSCCWPTSRTSARSSCSR